MEQQKERIKPWMAFFMGAVALFIDGLQALLTALIIGIFIGPVITAASYFLFWFWFKLLNVSFITNPKKLIWFLLPGIADSILSALPGLSVSVISTILITRSEDRGGLLGKAANIANPLSK